MVALTLELAGVASSSVTTPEGFLNIPRTFEKTCLQLNSTEEFSGSRSHFVVRGRAMAGADGPFSAGAEDGSGPVEGVRVVAVSRELQAGTDSSAITASSV